MGVGCNPIKSSHNFGYVRVQHGLVKEYQYVIIRLVRKMQ